ncbi:hypothetical protein [Bacillus sp. FJAT-18017]|uniref:hypothetical protein n=1 Tax=Bacillus sp. FJAT-18017 TaxID=1705566 RepID=UPI000AF8045B|nr:hypothetical protein [Bacillus sp. FJAT-18017]
MYDIQLLAQLKAKEVEQQAREAWKFQHSPKDRNSFFKRLFSRNATTIRKSECACTSVC